MIEILFEESEACSMKCAKGLAKQPQTRADGPTAVIGNPPQFGRKEAWAMIEGSSDEVVCLSYLMDLGDIRQPFDRGTDSS